MSRSLFKLSAFVLAVVILLMTFSKPGTADEASPKPIATGFTMMMTVVENGRLTANVRRQIKSSGDFLEETWHLNPDGSIASATKSAGTASQGAVSIDDTNKKLNFFGRAGVIHSVSEAELKALRTYVREDSLLGYRVIVQRNCDPATRCTEYWQAPDLGSDNVKVEIIAGDDRITKEAVSIVMGEPSFQVPDYPTSVSPRLANPGKP